MSEYLNQKIRRPAPPQISHLCDAQVLPNIFPIIHVVEGTIVSFSSRRGRTPDLYTVQYIGGFTERLTIEEVQIGISYMERRLTSCLPTTAIDHERGRFNHYDNTMKERYDMGMEIKVSHEIIWKLILVAAIEIEYEQRITDRFQTLQAESDKNKTNGSNSMRYYREHPTSYLGGQYVPPAKREEPNYEGQVVFTPNLVAQRMRTGISMACDFYQSKVIGDPLESRRSSRIASSSSPVVKPNMLDFGGCVALTLLNFFQEIDDASNAGNAGEILRDVKKTREENDNENPDAAMTEVEDDEEINQFFNPTSVTLFNHLRAGRSTSATDIQTAICYAMEDSIPATLPLLDITKLSDDLYADPDQRVTLVCSSGECLKDLQTCETSFFARCKFKIQLEYAGDDLTEVKEVDSLKSTVDFRLEEKAWKARKHFETWRYQCVMGGKTLWPSWGNFVSDTLKKRIVSSGDKSGMTKDTSLVTSKESENMMHNADQKQESDDFALAKAIAEPTSSRRSRRAARGDTSDGPIFYGANQSLTAQQIIETLFRVIAQSHLKGMSLLDLKKLIMGDGERSGNTPITELKKIRVALGKLMFRLGKVSRIFVNSKSDKKCWEKISSASSLTTITFLPSLPARNESLKKSKTNIIDADDKSKGFDLLNGGNMVQVSSSSEKLEGNQSHDFFEAKRDQELSHLEEYIRNLHETELALREIILKHSKTARGPSTFQQICPSLLATSADEKENEPESYDWEIFHPGKESNDHNKMMDLPWTVEPSHHLMGKIVYRPSAVNQDNLLHLDHGAIPCGWYKIVSYCPAVKAEDFSEDNEISKEENDTMVSSTGNQIVGRRIRFRADHVVPNSGSDTGTHPQSPGVESENSSIVLTEAQVYAGIDAASLQQQYYSKNEKGFSHPFRGLTGMRYLLYKITTEDEEEPIQGLIAGHETMKGCNASGLEFRVLMLLEDGMPNDDNSGFWAILSDDASMITVVESNATYRLEQQEYHQSSLAYETCEVVLSYLKSNVKIVPFLEPVDPVALNIPDYFDTIDSPMDLSTVEKHLVEGKYGRIPPGGTYHSPIGKMLNGPFYDDIMLIFDNAMNYNPKGDWIHNDAHLLKGLAKKKIETLAAKAERQVYASSLMPTSSSKQNTSMYADENSDVDMYEYESDYDDYADNTRKRKNKRNRGGKIPSKVEDYATRAIENLVSAPNRFDVSLTASLPISTDVNNFALPQEWTCAKYPGKNNETPMTNGDNEMQERENILILHAQMKERQSSTVRRSARSHANSVMCAKDSQQASDLLRGVGYVPHAKYLSFIKDVVGDDSFTTLARNRNQVESIREALHEECYANLYYKYCSKHAIIPVVQESTFEDGSGIYCDGLFPPYLGRIVPNSRSSDVTWEINSELVIPALRWVLRGLVHSGHLTEWEPFSLSTYDIETLLLPNHTYYCDGTKPPFAILDSRRKKVETAQQDEEEEVELSAYEKMRAERVARNKERLKELGLA